MPRNSWVTGGMSSDTSERRAPPAGNNPSETAGRRWRTTRRDLASLDHPFSAQRARVFPAEAYSNIRREIASTLLGFGRVRIEAMSVWC